MNIFLSSPDPRECAQALDSLRVNKMAVETAQLLSTALVLQGVQDDGIYRPTHTAHPCSHWARRSRANFNWLVEHGLELVREYEFRTEHRREHASEAVITRCHELRDAVPDAAPLTFDFNSSGFDTGNVRQDGVDGPFYDYKLCLVHKWRYLDGHGGPTGRSTRSKPPTWGIRGAPTWRRSLWGVNFSEVPQK